MRRGHQPRSKIALAASRSASPCWCCCTTSPDTVYDNHSRPRKQSWCPRALSSTQACCTSLSVYTRKDESHACISAVRSAMVARQLGKPASTASMLHLPPDGSRRRHAFAPGVGHFTASSLLGNLQRVYGECGTCMQGSRIYIGNTHPQPTSFSLRAIAERRCCLRGSPGRSAALRLCTARPCGAAAAAAFADGRRWRPL